jgi:hypothetical protein
MPERAIGHFEEFRRARSNAVARFECGQNVGPLYILNGLFHVDATLRNMDIAVGYIRMRRTFVRYAVLNFL